MLLFDPVRWTSSFSGVLTVPQGAQGGGWTKGSEKVQEQAGMAEGRAVLPSASGLPSPGIPAGPPAGLGSWCHAFPSLPEVTGQPVTVMPAEGRRSVSLSRENLDL